MMWFLIEQFSLIRNFNITTGGISYMTDQEDVDDANERADEAAEAADEARVEAAETAVEAAEENLDNAEEETAANAEARES
jgi:hypothetical protein